MTTINSFYEVVSRTIKPEIQDARAPKELPAHWIVILDEEGVAVTRADSVGGQVLTALVDNGAHGAAFVTQAIDSREVIMADVLVAMPRNSDVRRAYVKRTGSGATLEHWEHMV
jgi:hypothetical protein